MAKKQVVIFGGSGFLGLNLCRALDRAGYEAVIVSRSAPCKDGPWTHVSWDCLELGDWVSALEGAYAVVNLAGKTVDCIKSPDNCDLILRSRVQSTQLIGKALQQLANKPEVWVQMSTAHIYGDPPSMRCSEDSPTGYGLAPIVGKAWEKAYRDGVPADMRQVILRTSFVVGKGGGALDRLSLVTKLGLGGTLGSGTQGMSWIHEEDMNRIFIAAIEQEEMKGVYIATAPNPLSNREFMRALRKALKMPIGLPAMAWMVKLGAPLLLRTDPELALYGRYCYSKRLQQEGFEFSYPHLAEALEEIYSRSD